MALKETSPTLRPLYFSRRDLQVETGMRLATVAQSASSPRVQTVLFRSNLDKLTRAFGTPVYARESPSATFAYWEIDVEDSRREPSLDGATIDRFAALAEGTGGRLEILEHERDNS